MLTGIDCESEVSCWAVGEDNAATGPPKLLAEHWNGGSWTVASTPSLSGFFLSIACRAATMCWATGSTNGNDLTARYVHGSWQQVAAPEADIYDGVACGSARNCWAVGEGYVEGTVGKGGSIAGHWSGATWSYVVSPRVPEGLFGVACPTPTECVAVGTVGQRSIGSQQAIAEVIRPA